MLDLLARIDQSVIGANAATRKIIECGAFTLMLDMEFSHFYCNYAVVTSDGPFDSALLADLRQAFEANDRSPRFEYRSDVAPSLAAVLESEGFVLERADPVMICEPADLLAPKTSHVTELVNAENIVGFTSAVGRAFGSDGTVNQDEANATVERIDRGIFASALAKVGSSIAGGASLVIHEDVAELAGVGTAPEYQRRGIASSVSHALISHFFANGGSLVWLSAGNPGAEATYASLGFRRVGMQLNYSLPEA
ncbi:MAG: GNAT family N-acetyltransferase [Fimbriimonas sp.]